MAFHLTFSFSTGFTLKINTQSKLSYTKPLKKVQNLNYINKFKAKEQKSPDGSLVLPVNVGILTSTLWWSPSPSQLYSSSLSPHLSHQPILVRFSLFVLFKFLYSCPPVLVFTVELVNYHSRFLPGSLAFIQSFLPSPAQCISHAPPDEFSKTLLAFCFRICHGSLL